MAMMVVDEASKQASKQEIRERVVSMTRFEASEELEPLIHCPDAQTTSHLSDLIDGPLVPAISGVKSHDPISRASSDECDIAYGYENNMMMACKYLQEKCLVLGIAPSPEC